MSGEKASGATEGVIEDEEEEKNIEIKDENQSHEDKKATERRPIKIKTEDDDETCLVVEHKGTLEVIEGEQRAHRRVASTRREYMDG